MEEQKKTEEAEKSANTIQNLGAAKAEKAVEKAKEDALGFETVTGKRVVLSKEDRKQRERKDSLDDISSGSDDSDLQAYLRRREKRSKKAAANK